MEILWKQNILTIRDLITVRLHSPCASMSGVNAGNYNIADSSCFSSPDSFVSLIIRWKLESNNGDYDLHTVTYKYCNLEICSPLCE